MLLGIPLHAAALYSGKIEIFSNYSYDKPIDDIFLAIHSFRMQAFFIIAGYFSIKALQTRTLSTWLQGRATRLVLPFCTALALIGPLLLLLDSINSCGDRCQAPGDYLTDALRQPSLAVFIGHLWFLEYLIALTLILAVADYAFRHLQPVRGLLRWMARLALGAPPVVVVSVMVVYAVGVSGLDNLAHVEAISVLWGTLNVQYLLHLLGFYLFGVYLAATADILSRYCQPDWKVAVLAVLAIIVYVPCERAVGNETAGAFLKLGAQVSWVIAGLAVTQVLLALSARFFANENKLVRRFVDSSFTIYIVHYPIAIMLGDVMSLAGLGIWPSFALIVILTTAISYAFHQVVAKIPILIFLLNGTPPRRRPSVRVA